MRKVEIRIDGDEYVSLADLKRELKAEHMHLVLTPDAERPLAFAICLGYDAQTVKATMYVDVGKVIHKYLALRSDCNGYDDTPDLKATRDAMAALVKRMDAWDRKKRNGGA